MHAAQRNRHARANSFGKLVQSLEAFVQLLLLAAEFDEQDGFRQPVRLTSDEVRGLAVGRGAAGRAEGYVVQKLYGGGVFFQKLYRRAGGGRKGLELERGERTLGGQRVQA